MKIHFESCPMVVPAIWPSGMRGGLHRLLLGRGGMHCAPPHDDQSYHRSCEIDLNVQVGLLCPVSLRT